MKKLVAVVFFVFLLLTSSSKTFADKLPSNLSGNLSKTHHQKGFISKKYILGPNDLISISIFNVPKLEHKEVRIQPDGKIVLAYVGSIDVSGLTINELKQILTKKYKYYIKKPQISIKLEQSRPFVVYVTGAVVNPGSYELDTNINKIESRYSEKNGARIERKIPLLSNILVIAGGISYDADLEHVQISNSFDNSKSEINLLALLENGDSTQDIYLMAGDKVHVPKLPTPLAVNVEKYKKFASATFSPNYVPIKVFGYVNSPGLIKLDPGQSINLNSAISAAGGYQSNAAYAPKKVYLSRVDKTGKLVTTVINPMSNDVTLLPNDIVYVPEKIRPAIGKMFDYVARITSPAVGVARAYNHWALMFDPERFDFLY